MTSVITRRVRNNFYVPRSQPMLYSVSKTLFWAVFFSQYTFVLPSSTPFWLGTHIAVYQDPFSKVPVTILCPSLYNPSGKLQCRFSCGNEMWSYFTKYHSGNTYTYSWTLSQVWHLLAGREGWVWLVVRRGISILSPRSALPPYAFVWPFLRHCFKPYASIKETSNTSLLDTEPYCPNVLECL